MIRAIRRLKRLTVKQKMHAGFGVVLVLLAVIASLTLYSLLAIQRSTTRVVENHQPAVITSMQVAENIKDAIGGLGFYLLSKEDAHKRAYLEHLAQARRLLKRLSAQATIQTNPEAAELVKRIERDVSDFSSYQERMFAFATDQAKNFPAMSYSAQNINPLSQQVLQTINSMLRSEEQQASPRLELIKLLNDMRYSWARLMSGIRAYLGFRGQASLGEINNHRELFLARFDRLKKQYGDELTFEQTAGIDELEKLLGSFAEHVDHVIAQHGSDRWRQDAHLFRSEMTPVLNRLNSDVQKLIDQQVDDIEGISQSLTDQATETAIVVIVMLLIAMAAVATLAYLLNKGIIKPMAHAVDSGLQAIGNVMDSFSGPDRASTYQGAAHTDEIDNVANTFHIMADALQEAVTQQRETTEELRNKVDVILSTVKRAADGDLTGKLDGFEGSDAIDALARGVRQMIDNLNALVTQVQQSGIRVTSSATEIAATAKQQEAAIAEQAASTSQIMATVNEISATSKELVNTMREVSDVSENTAQAAGDGHGALEAMESTMQQMREATDSITSKLAVLNEKAGNINNVVTTINKVADQTNLLSLNAAIEAEKAGEYGRGFAVVATEIRRLADQTAVATWDIEQMVKEMQSAVSAGVMGMDKFSEEVTRSVDEVRQVGGQLLQIIEEVQALTPRFDSVNTGMQSQSQAADQISESMTQLNEIAQQTAESVRQSNQSIQQLKDAAQSLQGGVSKFKVSG